MSETPRLIVWLGGGALLAAAAIDTVAIIGRHLGVPLHGSIELVQAAILMAGAVALIVATLAGSHARVHLMLDRVKGAMHSALNRMGDALSALLFLAFLIGGLWIAADLWRGHEVSEIIGVPYAILRISANVALLVVSYIFLRDAVRGQAE
jgi:TRAP-type C4-dicarboxylate transport system permease small subunit